jgi:Cu/Ag efflux protein CusF
VKTTTSISRIAILGLIALAAGALGACSRQDGGQEPTEPAAQAMPEEGPSVEEQPAEKDSMAGMPMAEEGASDGSMHSANGTIQSIDQSAGTVKIAHGPVASMKWPAMTMDFKVENTAALGALKEGQAVDFMFTEKAPGQYMISEISPKP